MAWPDEIVGMAAWVGSEVRDVILAAAGILRESSAPGLVSIVLVLFLCLTSAFVGQIEVYL